MKHKNDDQNSYNLSERLDHIAYMFNVRTAGKAYENFIVNAIYAKVGEPELMPFTQQYVHSPSDPRKYYLMDLYFPQIKYGIEVDEGYHMDDEQQVRDSIREEDIKSAIECEVDRIPIFGTDGKRSYEEICGDIDRIVRTIREKIAKVGPLIWATNKDKKEDVKKRGWFNAADDVYFDSITEVYNICGGKRTGRDKGSNVTMLRKCYYRLNKKYKLWVPTLAIECNNGVTNKEKTEFENTLSEDHNILKEKKGSSIGQIGDPQYKRVVFVRMKDRYGRPCIKFIGVFEPSQESTDQVHIYRRISKEVMINDLT